MAPPLVIPAAGPGLSQVDRTRIADRSAQVACEGAPVKAIRSEAPPPLLWLRPEPPVPVSEPEPGGVLLFDIDAAGRPVSIRPEPRVPSPIPPTFALGEVEAALTGWRFAPAARTGCRLTVSGAWTDLRQAPPAILARALALEDERAARAPTIMEALRRPGDDCARRPPVRLAVYPALRRSELAPHSRAWTTVRFAIDDQGRPANLETLDASDEPRFEAAVRQAVAETVFAPGQPRQGCMTWFSLFGESDPAGPPPAPDVDALNQCTPETEARFTHGSLNYPEALRRRGVEGWAVVRYDIATWGQPGGVRLLDAQPASAFGDQAERIVRTGRATAASAHAPNCVDRVFFRLSEKASPDAD